MENKILNENIEINDLFKDLNDLSKKGNEICAILNGLPMYKCNFCNQKFTFFGEPDICGLIDCPTCNHLIHFCTLYKLSERCHNCINMEKESFYNNILFSKIYFPKKSS